MFEHPLSPDNLQIEMRVMISHPVRAMARNRLDLVCGDIARETKSIEEVPPGMKSNITRCALFFIDSNFL